MSCSRELYGRLPAGASGSENPEPKEEQRGDSERDQDGDDPAKAAREEKEHAGLLNDPRPTARREIGFRLWDLLPRHHRNDRAQPDGQDQRGSMGAHRGQFTRVERLPLSRPLTLATAALRAGTTRRRYDDTTFDDGAFGA